MENEDKFVWKKGDVQPLTNDKMECKGCVFRIATRHDICLVYKKVKPTDVLKGGKCESFEAI